MAAASPTSMPVAPASASACGSQPAAGQPGGQPAGQPGQLLAQADRSRSECPYPVGARGEVLVGGVRRQGKPDPIRRTGSSGQHSRSGRGDDDPRDRVDLLAHGRNDLFDLADPVGRRTPGDAQQAGFPLGVRPAGADAEFEPAVRETPAAPSFPGPPPPASAAVRPAPRSVAAGLSSRRPRPPGWGTSTVSTACRAPARWSNPAVRRIGPVRSRPGHCRWESAPGRRRCRCLPWIRPCHRSTSPRVRVITGIVPDRPAQARVLARAAEVVRRPCPD